MVKLKNTKKQNDMNDWIASLAKKSTASDANSITNVPTLSKEERKQKRAIKKARKQQQQEDRKPPPKSPPTDASRSVVKHYVDPTKRRLKRLAIILENLKSEHHHDRCPYDAEGRPTKKKKKRPLNGTTIQPRRSDYSGIGLARESLFLEFEDPSHVPKLEEEFHEHIAGFFGKQRTKAMKKQLDGNMLWRQMANQKKQEGGQGGIPKKFANLSTDERVQAMIDAGMV